MVGPDNTPKDLGWLEGFGAFLLMILTLGGQAWRYIRESKKDDAVPAGGQKVILEQAEIADLQPIRALLPKIEQLLNMRADLAEVLSEISDVKETDDKILDILQRIDREDEIERRAEARAREIESERRAREDRFRRPD